MNKNIEFTELALAEIDAMRNKLHDLRAAYGENSPEYMKAVTSFANVMHKIIMLGGTVCKESHLCLLGSNDYLTYGVIWFGDKNADSELVESGEWSVHT